MFYAPVKWRNVKAWAEVVGRVLPYRVWALYYAWRMIFSPSFTKAVDVVREVAHDPSTRNLKYWGEINRQEVSNPKQGENIYRNFSARLKLGDLSPLAALKIELAYQAYRRVRK